MVNKQIWIDVILEDYIPETSFLKFARDMSEFVEYNKINLSEAGAVPKVKIDNNEFPLKATERTDKGIEVPLHTFDSEPTVVRNIDKYELSYDKMQSVTRSHKLALLKSECQYALHSWAPNKHAEDSPVINTSGELVASAGGKRKRLTFKDVLSIEAYYRGRDVNPADIGVCLSPEHLADLQAEDMKLYTQILSTGKLFQFKLFTSSLLPRYLNGNKQVAGASTGDQASIFWHKNEAMFALGDTDVFIREKDPFERGDIFGAQQRFHAQMLRNYNLAITSGKEA